MRRRPAVQPFPVHACELAEPRLDDGFGPQKPAPIDRLIERRIIRKSSVCGCAEGGMARPSRFWPISSLCIAAPGGQASRPRP